MGELFFASLFHTVSYLFSHISEAPVSGSQGSWRYTDPQWKSRPLSPIFTPLLYYTVQASPPIKVFFNQVIWVLHFRGTNLCPRQITPVPNLWAITLVSATVLWLVCNFREIISPRPALLMTRSSITALIVVKPMQLTTLVSCNTGRYFYNESCRGPPTIEASWSSKLLVTQPAKSKTQAPKGTGWALFGSKAMELDW